MLKGFAIHGTGNASNNKIIGNSSDNILDGVRSAEQMGAEMVASMLVTAIGLYVPFPGAQEDKVVPAQPNNNRNIRNERGGSPRMIRFNWRRNCSRAPAENNLTRMRP